MGAIESRNINENKTSVGLANGETHAHEHTVRENTSAKKIKLTVAFAALGLATVKINTEVIARKFTGTNTPNVDFVFQSDFTVMAGKEIKIEVLNQSGSAADCHTNIQLEQS